jgi:DNA-binding PadR family transcriptional regulator
MDAKQLRLSRHTLRALKMMLEKPLTPYSGAEIARSITVGAGTIYPLLQRLENAGWVKSHWEKVDPVEEGRPRRRLYKLAGRGQTEALKALAEFQLPAGELAWAR